MVTFIALIRGINVSGQRMIKMADLKALFESLGFASVQTYIQSGNLVFQVENLSENELNKLIQSAILKQFGFEVEVQVFSESTWKQIIVNNPFVMQGGVEEAHLYVSLLANKPSQENVEKLASLYFPEEFIQLRDQSVYLYVPQGYGKAKLNNNFLESKLKVSATTRNWKTMLALVNMIQ